MSKLYPATGFPQLLPEEGILCDTAEMRFPLGEVVKDAYGNFFRYVKASEALAVGEIVTQSLQLWIDNSSIKSGLVGSRYVYGWWGFQDYPDSKMPRYRFLQNAP